MLCVPCEKENIGNADKCYCFLKERKNKQIYSIFCFCFKFSIEAETCNRSEIKLRKTMEG